MRVWTAGESKLGGSDIECVVPLPQGGLWHWQRRTQVMGILNLTPDSFSDGGRFMPHGAVDVPAAVAHAVAMVNPEPPSSVSLFPD